MLGSLVKKIVFVVTGLARPLARLWAPGGYFASRDLALIKPGRIVMIACHWLGDTFWAIQVMDGLRRRFPDSEFFVITKPLCVDLWAGIVPAANILQATEVTSDRRREHASFREITSRAKTFRRYRFDLAIDLTGNRYSAWFTFALRPSVSLGGDGGELGWLYSRWVDELELPGRHLSEKPFRIIAPLLDEVWVGCRPTVPKSLYDDPTKLCSELGLVRERYFVVVPGAGWPGKQWPAERFAESIKLLCQTGLSCVVIGSKYQEQLCRQVAGDLPNVRVFAGQAMRKVITLLAGAAGILCNDSGPGHIAAAMGIPTAVIFTGETDPATCAPLGPADSVKIFHTPVTPAEIDVFLRGFLPNGGQAL